MPDALSSALLRPTNSRSLTKYKKELKIKLADASVLFVMHYSLPRK